VTHSLRLPMASAVLRVSSVEADGRLGFWDQAALWASLGCALTALAPGAYLVPANSLPTALVSALWGALLGGALLAVATGAAARDGRSLQGFLREALGARAGGAAGLLLFARNVIWLAFLLALAGDAGAALLGDGGATRIVALLAAGGVALGFALVGPRLLLPQLVKPVLTPVALAAILIVAVSSYLEMGIPDLLKRQPPGGWPSFWQGADLVGLVVLAWLPAAGTISRSARSPAGASAAALLGFAPAVFAVALLGAVYVPLVNASESWELLTVMPFAAAALLVLLVLEADGLVLLAYAGGAEASEESGRAFRSGLAVALAVAIAAYAPTRGLEGAAFAAGLFFLPPVLLQWRLGGRRHDGWRWRGALLASWAAGFVAAAWSYPGSKGPLRDLGESLSGQAGLPFPLADSLPLVGALLPAIAGTLACHWLLSRLLSRVLRG
jgi:purine-cytosine permease-like protein